MSTHYREEKDEDEQYLEWLTKRLDEIKDDMKELAYEYALLYKTFGDVIESCNDLSVEDCSTDDRCSVAHNDYTGEKWCSASSAEKNIVNSLEDQLTAAGIDPEDLHY